MVGVLRGTGLGEGLAWAVGGDRLWEGLGLAVGLTGRRGVVLVLARVMAGAF